MKSSPGVMLAVLFVLFQSILASAVTIQEAPMPTELEAPMPTEKVVYAVKSESDFLGPQFMGASDNGDVVNLFYLSPKDEASRKFSGRQSWVFIKLKPSNVFPNVGKDEYRIEVRKPGSARKMLSCDGDGKIVDLWHESVNGCQRWKLIPLPDGSFNIKSVGSKGPTFLSRSKYAAGAKDFFGTVRQVEIQKIDLVAEDDETGAQRWKLSPEDLVITAISFETGNKSKMTNQPDFIVEQTLRNASDIAQSLKAEFTKKAVETSSFEHQHGFSFALSATQKFGLPSVAQGEISVTAATQTNWTTGKKQTREDTQTYSFEFSAPAKSTVKATATVSRVKLDVPYSVTGKSKITGETITSKGVWRGVSVGKIYFSISQE
jgi:hypothetical protein